MLLADHGVLSIVIITRPSLLSFSSLP
eukprot:COSAG06_NODE_33162_length_494_cov_0.906329_1_plen_26_part_10